MWLPSSGEICTQYNCNQEYNKTMSFLILCIYIYINKTNKRFTTNSLQCIITYNVSLNILFFGNVKCLQLLTTMSNFIFKEKLIINNTFSVIF